MNKKLGFIAILCVVLVLVAWNLATTPQERSLYYQEYTPLEHYPAYYYANFSVASSDINAELWFDIHIDTKFGYPGPNCSVLWALYELPLQQFEETFNLTEANDAMSTNSWKPQDFGAVWAGWFFGGYYPQDWNPITSGDYVLIFWVRNYEPTAGWSATLAVSLRTRFLQFS
ncbi:MAG: hypothetical protein ACFFCP_10355 [Promethearchaeota archaeon]